MLRQALNFRNRPGQDGRIPVAFLAPDPVVGVIPGVAADDRNSGRSRLSTSFSTGFSNFDHRGLSVAVFSSCPCHFSIRNPKKRVVIGWKLRPNLANHLSNASSPCSPLASASKVITKSSVRKRVVLYCLTFDAVLQWLPPCRSETCFTRDSVPVHRRRQHRGAPDHSGVEAAAYRFVPPEHGTPTRADVGSRQEPISAHLRPQGRLELCGNEELATRVPSRPSLRRGRRPRF